MFCGEMRSCFPKAFESSIEDNPKGCARFLIINVESYKVFY